ncbi:hypothetical protein BY996DRAFT_6415009 [Phakopsora pachyrhizi]|nr:hypothetical protein BY996DRAFT_6415009 [Phakopsora pachyrhizi]
MASISKRLLNLIGHEKRVRKRPSYRFFNLRTDQDGGALDSIIFGKLYDDIANEFCSILNGLDESVDIFNRRYFNFNEVTGAIDDPNLYGWREIAHRLLDSLLLVLPDTKYPHVGRMVVQKVLKDNHTLGIVKQQVLKHISNKLSLEGEFVDFESYVRVVTSFDGNLFGELSLKDQYDVLSGYWKKIFETENVEQIEAFRPLTDPKIINRLANKLGDEKTKLLGKDLINLISFPDTTKTIKTIWFPMYLTLDLLMRDNSKFQVSFDNQIISCALNEKFKILKNIIRLKSEFFGQESYQTDQILKIKDTREDEIWKDLKDEKVSNWLKIQLERQHQLLKRIQNQKIQLEIFKFDYQRSKSDHNPIKKIDNNFRSISTELGYWINTEILSDICKFLNYNQSNKINQIYQIIHKIQK